MTTLNATSAFPTIDPLEQMARDDREDWELLRRVVGVAVAMLLIAVASSYWT